MIRIILCSTLASVDFLFDFMYGVIVILYIAYAVYDFLISSYNFNYHFNEPISDISEPSFNQIFLKEKDAAAAYA